jgi:hypothetical protein
MHKNWYHEQLKQLVGAEIIQVEFIQQPNYSELVRCLVVRQNYHLVFSKLQLTRRAFKFDSDVWESQAQYY